MSDRWGRVEAVLHEALSRPPQERAAYLDEACADDPEVRREVSSLLAQESGAQSFLDEPVYAAPSIPIGQRIGVYRVDGRVGAGGMGEVYRAHDTRLGRNVAIKFVSRPLAHDPEAFVRIGQEARALAALNHPNIASIYGVEETNGLRAVVMELLDGETLADRTSRGRLRAAEAVAIAAQIADGLAAAHEKGIVHRDVKPTNIQITADGRVKILDFGIAKIGDPASVGRTTITTRDGRVIGTPAYMSPEQARGDTVDRQTDVWAFGCILFEMLSGVRAFDARTASDAIAAVLEHEPDWSVLPQDVPAQIRQLLRQCLEKDKARRLRDLRDVRLMLEEVQAARPGVTAKQTAGVGWRERAVWAFLIVAVALAAALIVRWRGQVQIPVTRFEIRAPDGNALANAPAISPDARQIVFVASEGTHAAHLWLRRLDADAAVMLNGTEGAAFPFWSPDSRSVAFFAAGKLQVVDVDGGPPVELADAPAGRGGAWDADAGLVFAPNTAERLVRIVKPGAPPVPFTTLRPGEVSHRVPFFVPGGFFGFYASARDQARNGIWIAPVTSPHSAFCVLHTADAAQYGSGYLFFVRNDNLVAQRLSTDGSRLEGNPVAVLDNVATSGSGFTGIPAISVSPGGSIVAHRPHAAITRLTSISRDGRSSQALPIDAVAATQPELSPDGSRVAFKIGERNAGELWIFDTVRRTATRAAASSPGVLQPLWYPDGQRLVVSSPQGNGGNNNLFRLVPQGALEPLVGGSAGMTPIGWAGQGLLYAEASAPPPAVIKVLEPDGGSKTYFDPHARIGASRVSPNGRAIAYTSSASGRSDVYLIGYPFPGQPLVVSPNGGAQPRWRADSRELCYIAADGTLMSLPVDWKGDAFQVGVPAPLMPLHLAAPIGGEYQYDVTRDGSRIIAALEQRARVDALTVIRNWSPR
jgi:eukaryotic-like serine/threonine-protein kinase